jgi:hypothetical protein
MKSDKTSIPEMMGLRRESSWNFRPSGVGVLLAAAIVLICWWVR